MIFLDIAMIGCIPKFTASAKNLQSMSHVLYIFSALTVNFGTQVIRLDSTWLSNIYDKPLLARACQY